MSKLTDPNEVDLTLLREHMDNTDPQYDDFEYLDDDDDYDDDFDDFDEPFAVDEQQSRLWVLLYL